MTKKVKERIVFHYLFTKRQQAALILLELNILLKMYQTKSRINQSLTICLGYKIMNLLWVNFIALRYKIYACRKSIARFY